MIRAWSSIRAGIDAFAGRFTLLMGAWLIILAAQQAIDFLVPDTSLWPLLGSLLAGVLVVPLYAGQHLIALKVVRGEPTSIRDLFRGFSRWGSLIGVSIATGIIVSIGTLLLVVPGIVWALMLLFAPIAVLDARDPEGNPKKRNAGDALQESQEITRGYKGVLFRIAFTLTLPWILIVALLTIRMYSPAFPIPHWALEVLAILSGTLFLGPVGATTYMTVYHKITSLRSAAYDGVSGLPGLELPDHEEEDEAQVN